MPAVSLVIPVHNSEPFLVSCLESVIGQTMRDMEIICIDDGSTDDSPRILADFAGRDARVRVTTQANSGQATARDRGLGLASGDYVMFLDNDDHFEPTMVEEAYERCVNDQAEITVFKIRYFDATTGDSFVPDWALRMDLIPDRQPFSRRDMPSTFFRAFTPALWNKMFKRSFLVDCDIHFRPDLRFTDDLAFTYTALALADRISVIDKPLVNYRTRREGSLWTKLSESPTDVVLALREARRRIAERGILDEIEPAFANAVLNQCLYNLSTMGTYEAFRTLYDELKSEAFSEFGLVEHPKDSYIQPEEYGRLARIMHSSVEHYLFDEMRLNAEVLAGQRERFKQTNQRLIQADQRLKETNERLEQKSERLKQTKERLKQTKERLALVQGKLDAIRRLLPYRIARAIVAVPRNVMRYMHRLRG